MRASASGLVVASSVSDLAAEKYGRIVRNRRRLIEFIVLASGVLVVAWLGVAIGASKVDVMLPIHAFRDFFLGNLEASVTHNIVANIRAPRVIMALLVGASLAISGASLQGVCRNPLADPGLLGISSGAAVGAVAMILFAKHLRFEEFLPLFSFAGPYLVSLSAFAGAAIATFSVYRLAQVNGDIQISTFLLAGVAINALSGAIIGGLSFVADDQALRLITFWMMGSLASATWLTVAISMPVLMFVLWAIYNKRHALNLILLGEANARFSGVDVDKVKSQILWLTALAVGVSVAFSGIIGFIGLVVPHILRAASDTNYRYLVINSALLGGGLLALADIASRMLIAPTELPIGILTSLIGAPFFIGLLIQQKRRLGFSL
ncbi:FecCD family ABC transporter permease [Arenicella xantha]|uniref:Iron complex transport system permease protein n=1 Tax=Arenicella xantha TaxID=644221 RepID=A0A395JGD4_9GAMM|nr:iron ABC transporter permease [Arenicella xantha]RBP48916.1 iron complex transport system permease protein [Arenicella xantha]